jgi:opacity protein-like surface antigen
MMKKLSFGFILLMLGAVLMSCNLQNDKNENDPKIEEAKKYTEKYIKENYLNVKEVTITETETNPMGLLVITGYLNKDENKGFSVNYDFNQKDVISGGVDAELK